MKYEVDTPNLECYSTCLLIDKHYRGLNDFETTKVTFSYVQAMKACL